MTDADTEEGHCRQKPHLVLWIEASTHNRKTSFDHFFIPEGYSHFKVFIAVSVPFGEISFCFVQWD